MNHHQNVPSECCCCEAESRGEPQDRAAREDRLLAAWEEAFHQALRELRVDALKEQLRRKLGKQMAQTAADVVGDLLEARKARETEQRIGLRAKLTKAAEKGLV